MKKILNFTFQRANNYGAQLQAFALQEFLKNNGYDCKICDCRIDAIEEPYKIMSFKNKNIIRQLAKVFVYGFKTFKRNYNFKKFRRNYLNLTDSIYKTSDLNNIKYKADAYIVGSDQVWNPNIVGELSDFYTLNFNNNIKKISYAASIGDIRYVENQEIEFTQKLAHIDYISVREKDAAEILKKLLNREIQIVLDPTLLLDADRWIHDFKITAQEKRGDYVLFYFLGQDRWYKKTTVDYCRNKGLKAMVLPMRKEDAELGDMMSYPDMSGFLSLIYNAHYIITDSFHGMMFSIIFRKQFMICARFNDGDTISQNSRIEDFCSRINLTGRYVKSPDEIDTVFKSHLDYHTISDKLDSEINSSKDYLRVALEEI